MGLGTDDGDEYFYYLKVHCLQTQIQCRTVLLLISLHYHSERSDPTLGRPARCDRVTFLNDIYDSAGFLYGTYSRRFR